LIGFCQPSHSLDDSEAITTRCSVTLDDGENALDDAESAPFSKPYRHASPFLRLVEAVPGQAPLSDPEAGNPALCNMRQNRFVPAAGTCLAEFASTALFWRLLFYRRVSNGEVRRDVMRSPHCLRYFDGV